MADHNINSEQDNAYIEALLRKLRASLGQTEDRPQESPDEQEEADPSADAPVKDSLPEDTPSPVEGATPDPAVAMPDPDEEERTEISKEASVPQTAPVPDAPEAIHEGGSAASSFPAVEPVSEETKGIADISADSVAPQVPELLTEQRQAIPPVSCSPEEDTTPSPDDGTSEVRTEEEAREPVSYAHTVLQGDPRLSGRNTAGRYLVFDLPAEETSSGTQTSSEPPMVPVPDSVSASDHSEEASLTDDGATDASAEYSGAGAPGDISEEEWDGSVVLPGADDSLSEAGKMPVPDKGSGEETASVSIWDTLPPLPHEEDLSAVTAPDTAEPAQEPGGLPDAQVPEGLFERKTRRKTLADCDFDASVEKHILVDKILEPSPDLEGEGDREKQNELWKQELRRKDFRIRFCTIAAGVCLVFLALLELMPSFTRALLTRMLLTRVPGAVHLIDLQIFLLAALFGAGQIYRGFAALRFRRVIPETLVSFATLLSFIGCIYLTAADFSGEYFCCLPTAFLIFASLLSDWFHIRSLRYSFGSYTATGHHFCAVYSDVTQHPLLGREFADIRNKNLFETASVSQIDGFTPAARQRVECRRASWISFAVAGASAILYLVLALVTKRDVLLAVCGMIVCFAGAMPLALFGVHRYLFYMLCARVSEERVGIAGETTVYDYAHTGVMTFEDTEAFPAGSVQLTGIKLCGDFRLDKALYLMASVFDTVGGPLNGVFRVSTADINISDNVEINALVDNGIDGRVNHDDVLIGTKEFLESRGVSVFRDVEDERAEGDKCRVLYLAYMGCLCAKFHLRYEMSNAFESNVEYYAKHGVTSAILTTDPLLNRDFLDGVTYVHDYDIRVVKKTKEFLVEEEEKPREASLITYGPRKTLRRMPFFFSSYAKYQGYAVNIMMVLTAWLAIGVPGLMWSLKWTTPLIAFLAQMVSVIPCVVFGILVRRLNPNK